MIYQVRSIKELGLVKRYIYSKEEIKIFIHRIIKETEKFRQGLENNPFPSRVSDNELRNSVYILSIDDKIIPDWKDIFGPEKSFDFSLCTVCTNEEKNNG